MACISMLRLQLPASLLVPDSGTASGLFFTYSWLIVYAAAKAL